MTSSSVNSPKHQIKYNLPLSKITTFRLGGNAKELIECTSPEILVDTIRYLSACDKDFILIGGGSNLVISDHGINQVIVRYVNPQAEIKRLDNFVLRVPACAHLDSVAKFSAEHGLSGINFASGIPGTVGGAVVGNAGAFGKQIGDILLSATLVTANAEVKMARAIDLDFGYRYSSLRETTDIVSEVDLQLSKGNSEELHKEREDILALRATKHPNLKTTPCAGSFFRNIEPTSKADRRQAAGWFLQEAGGKDLQYGGAKIYSKHANIIVKSENCSSQDVYELSKKMQQIVKSKFNIDLVREVRFVGDFEGKPTEITQTIW